jgi:F420-non-reducing hydrogenase iron-sulfur subunit
MDTTGSSFAAANSMDGTVRSPKILILATLSGGYRGADATGQSHLDYPPDTYILPVRSAAIFPESFYLNAFERGIDAILVLYSGTDSPYKGESERTAEIINRTYLLMKERCLDPRRLRLAAICTVCVRPFLTEIQRMHATLEEIGLVPHPLPVTAGAQVPAVPA